MIETERVLLQEVTSEDKSFLFELMNTASWIQYIGDRNIRTVEDAEEYIEKNIRKAYQEYGLGMYKMVSKENDKPMGLCGLLKRDYLNSIDIGFAILPEYEGKGYTYEAAKAVRDFGFNTLKTEKIAGITMEENVKSRKLLEKLGLKYVGMVRTSPDTEEIMLYSS